MKNVLPGLLRGLNLGAKNRKGPLARLREAWPALVGEDIAVRTRVVGFKHGKLTVEVASAALKHDLATFRRPELLHQLKERFPDLDPRSLRFRVGSV